MDRIEMQKWALRQNARSLVNSRSPEEFDHFARWLVVYLRNLGVMP